MPDTNQTETILIKEGTILPPGLVIETEAFLPGWRILKSPDRLALTRTIEAAHWHFFYLAGDLSATALGHDLSGTLRRAAKRILARQKAQEFNSLEITSVITKSFLGIPYTSVIAHSRHIQQDLCLVPEKTIVLRMPAGTDGDVAEKRLKALISTS
jgi:hypothetical protein